MQNFANYFAEFTNGSHSLAIAISGCTGMRDWTGESNETSSGRNADICISVSWSGGFRCRQYLSWDSPGRRKDRYGTYPSRRGQRYWIPGGGNHHYYREENQVRGLTTAAGLWTTATLGIMLGSGMLEVSLMMFALIIVTMFGIARVSRVQEQYNRYIGLYMEIDKSMTRGESMTISMSVDMS